MRTFSDPDIQGYVYSDDKKHHIMTSKELIPILHTLKKQEM